MCQCSAADLEHVGFCSDLSLTQGTLSPGRSVAHTYRLLQTRSHSNKFLHINHTQ